MLSEERRRELDRLLDGDLSDEDRVKIQASLESDPEAIDWLAERALLHAHLRRTMQRRGTETRTQTQPPVPQERPVVAWSPFHSWAAIAAALVALLGGIFLLRPPSDPTFATVTQTSAAQWEDSDLPTAVGSRLAPGTLRLATGLATIEFDSGALVTIEAPATLTLVDAMNCDLMRGTVVSDIPESAIGFRIQTPSADVVDYGTRFAVSVFEETGETLTQVMEGEVHVEYAESDKIVELTTGQRDQVLGEAADAARKDQEQRTMSESSPLRYGPEWELLRTSKDAYTGRVPSHESNTLLYVKSLRERGPTRISWLGFDLRQIEKERIEEAELLLHFAPTGFGLASFVPDAEFGVYGLVGQVPEWDESIQNGQFPEEHRITPLGSFVVPHGVQEGQFRVSTEALAKFLRDHPDSEITLKVVRETKETETGGLVHGFASRRHPFLPAPTLAIRQGAR